MKIILFIIGYSLAAAMFEDVSFNLLNTEWLNGFTYLKIGIGYLLLCACCFAVRPYLMRLSAALEGLK